MAKVKYDVTGVEDTEFKQAPVGLYQAKVAETNVGESSSGQPMLTIVLELTHDGKGKKLKETYGRVWHRVPLEHWDQTAGWTFRLKEFLKALGLGEKGSFDPDKLEGDKLQVKLRAGKDLDDNYRPEVGKLMALASDDDADEEEPEEDEDEQDEDEEEETDAPSVEDLEAMSLSDLKEQAEEQEVEVEGKATKKKLVAALTEHFWGEDEEEDEDEEDDEEDEEDEDTEDEEDTEEEEDDDDEAEDYSDWSRNALIKEARSRDMKVTKAMSEDDIREILVDSDGEDDEDEDEEEEEEQDYSDWDLGDLKSELKERGLKTTGKKHQLIKRLEDDDESEEDPF